MTAYGYKPIGAEEIRLLTIDSSQGLAREPLYRLDHVPLTHEVRYLALSDVWGSIEKTCSIHCSGSQLAITESVLEALTGLRQYIVDAGLPIWVDAVCINQDDMFEKARQIRNMHNIYRRAVTTIIWLGPASDDSNIAMRAVAALDESLTALTEVPEPDFLPQYGLPSRSDTVWPALGCLFARPWFFRLWTFQEIMLASKAEFHCGSLHVDWQHLARFSWNICMKRLWHITMSEKTQDVEFRRFVSLSNIFELSRQPEEWKAFDLDGRQCYHFSRLLPLAQTKFCGEERDRVYAMLSLTSERFRDRIPVDYAVPLPRLNIEVGKACLHEDAELSYLQYVSTQIPRPGMPSWCVYNEQRELEMLFGRGLLSGIRRSVTRADLANQPKVRSSIDSDVIHVEGFRVDVVHDVIPMDFVWTHRMTRTNAHAVVNWHTKCQRLACRTLGFDDNEIPPAHACTLAAHLL